MKLNVGEIGIEADIAAADAKMKEENRRLCKHEDYVYDKLENNFWDIRSGSLHVKEAVDASIPIEHWSIDPTTIDRGEPEDDPPKRGRPKKKNKLIPPSREIMRVERNLMVEGSGFWPGQPRIIEDWYLDKNGYHYKPGWRIFNHYLPPPELKGGEAEKATPWVDHVKKLWPNPVEHNFFFDYWAHMVQKTAEKCNAAIVLSGHQGIGKDAAIAPLRHVMGEWNVKGIDPDQLFEKFQPFKEAVMLTIDEVRGSKDDMRPSTMYNILKTLIATPPDTLPMNDKFERIRYVKNVLRIVITTNDKFSLFLPEDDRRMMILHSNLESNWHVAAGDPEYFIRLFAWFHADGFAHIGAWLRERDISQFKPKERPPRTDGWSTISTSWGEPEDSFFRALQAIQDREWRIKEWNRQLECEEAGVAFEAAIPPGKLPDEPVLLGTELLDVIQEPEELLALMKSPRKLAHRAIQSGYEAMTPDIKGKETKYWQFSRQDQHDPSKQPTLIRSRIALVHESVLSQDHDVIVEMIKARGKLLLDRKIGQKDPAAAVNVVPFPKPRN